MVPIVHTDTPYRSHLFSSKRREELVGVSMRKMKTSEQKHFTFLIVAVSLVNLPPSCNGDATSKTFTGTTSFFDRANPTNKKLGHFMVFGSSVSWLIVNEGLTIGYRTIRLAAKFTIICRDKPNETVPYLMIMRVLVS